ncbi:hypothetical protein GJ699_02340 [Duganella sp. FT80W]|uniref:Uncharacterized protein n=1 Tax=Duganella guangzhouensis TaxID=2666084 RepID=A0A6I2KXS9_9BURK|nr:hypothetical protein [Duganella guangzhouensis]MRW88819.1 hypothetical protein [Duganella guangzhouensis]
MSAADRPLLDMLLAAAQATPAERALQNLLTIMRNNAARLEPHEFRYYEIALEGLGVPSRQRQIEVRVLIQIKRDWLETRRAAREGGGCEETA